MGRKRAGILIFDDVEVLDFCGPFEVLSVARLDEAKRATEPSPFEVMLVAEGEAPVVATGGLRVVPDHKLESCPPLDILIVPGGWGTRRQVDNPVLIGWIKSRASGVEILASVCTGAFLLAAAGLLDGRRATTHWKSLDRMASAFPKVAVCREEQVVEDGHILTSAGISAGIDMAMKLVERCCGGPVAKAAARHMEYPYPESDRRRVPVAERP